MLRLTGQGACVALDLEPPQEKQPGNAYHHGGDEKQQKLQVDPFHRIGDSGSVDGGGTKLGRTGEDTESNSRRGVGSTSHLGGFGTETIKGWGRVVTIATTVPTVPPGMTLRLVGLPGPQRPGSPL